MTPALVDRDVLVDFFFPPRLDMVLYDCYLCRALRGHIDQDPLTNLNIYRLSISKFYGGTNTKQEVTMKYMEKINLPIFSSLNVEEEMPLLL